MQYATSTYGGAGMKPKMIAIPNHAADVVALVKYARGKQLKVVARSGGHQYCGFSSGGNSTILVSMQRLNKIEPWGAENE
jgi:FAD/FMN-containing dehydrogenase